MTHGDDSGLIIPPQIAENKVVILPIGRVGEPGLKEAEEKARKYADQLIAHGISAIVDTKYDQSLGYRINEYEVVGIPLRLEIGGKELEKNIVKFARRDNFEKGDIQDAKLVADVASLLEKIQEDLTEKSQKAKVDLTVSVKNFHEFKDVIGAGKKFVEVSWCENSECEAKIKEETKATPRVCELKNIDKKATGKCFHCDEDAKRTWLFAQSY
jgi:prolyl-tRNA synthetase